MLAPQHGGRAHQAAVAQAAKRQAQAELTAKREAARKAAQQAGQWRIGASQPAAGSAPTASGSPQSIAQAMLGSYGWSSSQFSCLDDLWNAESPRARPRRNPHWRPTASRRRCLRLKMASAGPNWQTSAATQIRWGLGYIKSTYGSPCAAWSHEEADGWYSPAAGIKSGASPGLNTGSALLAMVEAPQRAMARRS